MFLLYVVFEFEPDCYIRMVDIVDQFKPITDILSVNVLAG